MKSEATKAWIRPLPERLINKIAAGEVVERPASVLKELVENAIDAGSTKIDVKIEKSGMSRIEIHDNGRGISSEQVEIAFSRHATSKIADFDDLEQVSTFGFRGEALPSIASVSRLRLVTKTAEEDHATEIMIEGGVVREKRPAHRAEGTSIVVEDLFFNTPARKKFLKSETTESRHLTRAAVAQTLGAVGVGFSVRINDRQVFSFAPDDSLAIRAAKTLGVAHDSLIPVDEEAEGFQLIGALGKPDIARTVRGGLYLFVNNRALRSTSLHSAVSLGYGELLAKGLFPVGVVQLTVDPATVDVNVHPAKNEVRLSQEADAHRFVRHAVRDSLRQSGIVSEFSFSDRGGASANTEPSGGAPLMGAPGPGVLTRPILSAPRAEVSAALNATEALFGSQKSEAPLSPAESAEQVEEPQLVPHGVNFLAQFANLYLLAQRGDELFLVDQHAAHERILYERTMREMSERVALSQRMLLPVNVELESESFLVWEERQAELTQIGFAMTHLGGHTIMIEGIPAVLGKKSPEKIFSRALEDIQRLQKSGYTPLKAVAQSIACRSAVMDGDTLNREQAQAIIDGLFTCETGYSCPHGRPTFVKISRVELDRKFGRE